MTQFNSHYYNVPVSITLSGTTSTVADLGNHTVSGILVPAGMTGTKITFLVSVDNITFLELRQPDGDAYAITINATAAAYAIGPQDIAGMRYIKAVSNAAEGAARVLTIVSILAVNKP